MVRRTSTSASSADAQGAEELPRSRILTWNRCLCPEATMNTSASHVALRQHWQSLIRHFKTLSVPALQSAHASIRISLTAILPHAVESSRSECTYTRLGTDHTRVKDGNNVGKKFTIQYWAYEDVHTAERLPPTGSLLLDIDMPCFS